MKRSLFLAIVALISAIFGIGLLLKPFELMAMYQVNVYMGGMFMARLLGSALIALAVIFWMGRKVTDSTAANAVLWGGLIYQLLATVLSFRVMQRGWMNSRGWSVVVLDGLITVGFANFLFRKNPA